MLRALLLALRFATELALLVALAVIGANAAAGLLAVVLAVLLPLAAAVVWAGWVAPRAGHRLRDPQRAAVEVVLFGVAVVGLVSVGHAVAAAVLAATAVMGAAGTRLGGGEDLVAGNGGPRDGDGASNDERPGRGPGRQK